QPFLRLGVAETELIMCLHLLQRCLSSFLIICLCSPTKATRERVYSARARGRARAGPLFIRWSRSEYLSLGSIWPPFTAGPALGHGDRASASMGLVARQASG